jgi:hypothetical protein
MSDDLRNDSAVGKQPALNRVTDQMLILDLWNGYRLQMEARRAAIAILGQFKAGHLRNAATGWRGY